MPAFEDRAATATAEKQAIGRATAALLEDGDTVLLDGGTTTLEVARALLGRPVQVVTNSLPIAQLLASSKETDLILIGGYVYPRTGVALGPLAIATMQGIRVRKAILGAGGIVAEGIYNSNLLLVETERQMMACGQEVMIVADHTKFGRLSLAWLCGLDEVGASGRRPRPARGVPRRPRGGGRADPPGAAENPGPADAANGAPRHGEFEDRSMSTLVATAKRDQVEQMVRSILRQQLGDGAPADGRAGGVQAEPRRQHLGAALPPDAGGRRTSSSARATSSRR